MKKILVHIMFIVIMSVIAFGDVLILREVLSLISEEWWNTHSNWWGFFIMMFGVIPAVCFTMIPTLAWYAEESHK